MKKSVCTYLISIFVLFSLFFDGSDACWGNSGPDYVDMTSDYDLLVGSDLVVNCTLRNRNVTIANKVISSSDLIIEKYNDTQYASKFTRVMTLLDDRTVQLKIPKATTNDTGFYFCKIFQSKDITPLTACGTKVNVGYPPHRIKEFSCISRNFDNIKCTWNTEENNVITNYTITKKIFNTWNLYQMCPTNTSKPNSCEWSSETDPVFWVDSRDIYFKVEGKNSLGTSVEEFKVDVYSIVIPNRPENLEILDIRQQSATIRWKPPKMRNLVLQNFKLKYEIRLSKVSHEFSDVTIYEIENSTTSFLLQNLIPHVTYNVTLRCQSAYSKNDSMWSDFVSAVFKTQAGESLYTKPPHLEIYNSTCYKIAWEAPIMPNGPIDFYELMWHKEEDASDILNKTVQISGANSVIIELKCSQVTDEGTTFLFHVRAVGNMNGKSIFGPYSESTQLKDCQIPKGFLARTVCFGTLLLAFCAMLFMVKIIYRISLSEKPTTREIRCESKMLSAELQIPESVIFEEGKHTKLGRKSGGNNNDCTCMLAIITTQNHLPPDNNNSFTDSEFLIPSSPYLHTAEPGLEICHKNSTKAHCAPPKSVKM